MKKLMILAILSTMMSFAQANEDRRTIPIVLKTGAATTTATGSAITSLLAFASLGGATTGPGAAASQQLVKRLIGTSVGLAGVTGYLAGSIIVDIDAAYFKGYGISATGDLFGPVFRKVYNLTNEDELPNYIITKDGVLEIVAQ